ncbi:MAG: SCO family protein, partial [Pyrinomonadaceae bacterium]
MAHEVLRPAAATEAAGFHYVWDDRTQQFAHASGVMVATPQGKLAQYFYGIEFSPRDLRLAMVQSSDERIGTVVDALTLYCYHYDPASGKYGLIAMNMIRVGATATMLVLGSFMFVMLRRERRG